MKQEEPLRLLIISESWNEAEVLTNHLRNAGYIVRPLRVEDEERLAAVVRDQDWDLLLHLPDDALDVELATVLALLADSRKDIPLIVVSDNISPQRKLEFLEVGARDTVPNTPPGLLQKVVRRELEGLRLRRGFQACQDSLRETERRCRILLNNARDAIAYVQEGAHILANPAYLQMFQFADVDEVIGVPLLDMVPPSTHHSLKNLLRAAERPGGSGEVQSLESQALRSDGGHFLARFEITPTILDGETCIQVVIHDLSPTTEFQDQINELSHRDFLTGLYNRQYFLQELNRTLPNKPGMIYLTVDNLATLRNKLGIAGTDQALKEIANIIIRHTESSDLVANFSDGVFTILATQGEEFRLRTLAERIRKKLSHEMIEVGGLSVNVSASIGFHHSNLDVKDSQTLLTRLEAAALAAREGKGTGIMVCFEDSKKSNVEESISIVKTALERNQFFFLYQPIVYLRGDGRELYEVFSRLAGPNGGQPIPAQVMRLINDTHLPSAVDRWTISRLLEVISNRQTRHGKPLQVLVGLSLDTLLDEAFPSWLGGKLKSLGVPPASLILQVDDNLVVDHYLRMRFLIPSLHGLGCSFALSNYRGSAVSSQLSQLSVDYFKIDGSIIRDLAINHEHQFLVRTINEQVHELGKHTLAESVRDANTLSLLWQYGIDYIQGEYLQKPSETMDYDFSNLFIE
ncbi:multidomain signaling protein FimX [Gammaproteobacteria bacterium]